MLKSRDITLPTKVGISQGLYLVYTLCISGNNHLFPVVTYGCESWTIKNAEYPRTDAFELWCWRRLLRVPWTARRSNQSILKEINPEYSLRVLILKLKLQYIGYLMQTANSLEKSLMLGKTEGRQRRGCQRMRWLDILLMQWTWTWANPRRWWGTGRPAVLQSMVSQSWTRLGDWTTTTTTGLFYIMRK